MAHSNCGTTSVNGGPSICAVPVYPREVTASLRKEIKTIDLNNAQQRKLALQRLQLPETMVLTSNGYRTMKDAAMIELQFPELDKTKTKTTTDGVLIHEALTLSVLVALYSHPFLEGFNIFGVVKEIGVDDEGLAEFYHHYFGKFPIYCDKSYSFYQGLGDRKSVELPSLWSVIKSLLLGGAWQRIKSKNISWNTKGEGVTKGGLIIFDKKGNPRYAYQEDMGNDLPVTDILHALEQLRQEEQQETKE
ncbi:AhpC/TSA antioxidant enzyme [Nitzschia inconspicua]|uniref:AhpC/TSA antioxidant enzyme n=1 Tax=Nitzschia inconspicua TaxID=303405 RepID=A0A9K3PTB2_9STRA|nr:AhpC/TSA antioxidant enzyme [Nitzschia inconspicua]KAG7358678.1 AhpC/TSA antioxidant enzyme [Nitzschia inconspicua]